LWGIVGGQLRWGKLTLNQKRTSFGAFNEIRTQNKQQSLKRQRIGATRPRRESAGAHLDGELKPCTPSERGTSQDGAAEVLESTGKRFVIPSHNLCVKENES